MAVLQSDGNPIVEMILKRHSKMEGRRENWTSHWEEVSRFVIPRKDDIYKSKANGEKKGNKIYTGHPVDTNEKLASALHGMLTNPSTNWFGLSTGDRKLDQNVEVKAWLQHAAQRMIDTLNQSNFQTQIHEVYLDLGGFGTGVLLIEEDKDMVFRFLSRPIYCAFIEENHKGIVDTVSFESKKTLSQIVGEFGEDILDDELKSELEGEDDKEYTVVHFVTPRTDRDVAKLDTTNKKFASYHILKEKRIMLKESGFDELPYVVPRWSKISGEVYGRSPAMKSLPDIKMLNAMQKATIEAAQKAVNPPLVAPDDGVLLPIRTAPGAINYKRAGTKDTIEPINSGARPDLGEALIRSTEVKIEKAFFIDELQIPSNDRMTATEIMQRREEQLRKLGPILGRQHFELLKPLINRIFGIMIKKDMFDAIPEILSGVDLEVRYTSQIAKAQRTADSDDFSRVMALVGPLAQAKPEMLDNFDTDTILRDMMDKFGLPSEYLVSKTNMNKVRAERQQAMSQQAQLETADKQADVAGKVSQIEG